MERRVMILSAGIGSGHNSAASALEDVIRNQIDVAEVRTVDVLQATPELYRSLYDDGYFSLVESVPWLVGWGYDAGDSPFRLGGSVSWWDQVNTTGVARRIRAYAPDLILCTHFLPARLVSLMQTRGGFSTRMAVVTTDYDFQGLWLTNTFSRMFLARAEAKAHLVALGLPEDRLTVSGIPVRNEFGQAVDRPTVLNRFGLPADQPVLLVSAGASGGEYALTIVRQLLARPESFRAVIVCGKNAALKDEIDALVGDQTDRFRVLGFTQEMPDLMRAADVFVGKPGGLSSSECMAAGLPMVLIDPIPGQEERNSDYLLEQGAAIRCNYDTTIGWKLGQLLADPARIRQMSEYAQRAGHPNAALDISTTMLDEKGGQLWISHRAQRSLYRASDRGLPPEDLKPERRIRTLSDATTGKSAVLITEAQRLLLARAIGRSPAPDPATLTLRRSRLRSLRRLPVDPFLLLTLHRVLGSREELVVEVS